MEAAGGAMLRFSQLLGLPGGWVKAPRGQVAKSFPAGGAWVKKASPERALGCILRLVCVWHAASKIPLSL